MNKPTLTYKLVNRIHVWQHRDENPRHTGWVCYSPMTLAENDNNPFKAALAEYRGAEQRGHTYTMRTIGNVLTTMAGLEFITG